MTLAEVIKMEESDTGTTKPGVTEWEDTDPRWTDETAMRIYPGQKPTVLSKSYRRKTARGQPPITRVEVSKINTKSTSLNKPPQVEEVETRKIADPTTKEGGEASVEDTTEVPDDDLAARADKDTIVESEPSLTKPNDNNFMCNIDPEMGVNLKYKHPVKTGVKEIISPENKGVKQLRVKTL